MRHGGFSLVEISIVLVVVATMLAGVLPAITEGTKVKDIDTTADRMEEIQKALQAYFSTNQELPCPSDITLGVNTANFGVQAANNSCTGGAPAANWYAPNIASPGPYDVVGGGVPTKTLGLPDEYAFDGWGRRIYYHVDPDATVVGTFNASGTIIIDDGAAGAPYRTSSAVYTLISGGRNGHGAYTRAGGTTRINTGSQNSDESRNCMTNTNSCTGPVVMTYDNIFVQKLEGATDPNDPTTNFDDIVTYKLRGSLLAGDAGGGDTLWTASGNHIYNTNAGGVGIGTTNPGTVFKAVIDHGAANNGLQVQSSLASTVGQRLSAPGVSYLDFNNTAAAVGSKFMRIGNKAGKLSFEKTDDTYTTATDIMTIDAANGNVGIGTTAPTALGAPFTGPALHLHGTGTGALAPATVNLSSQASATGSWVGSVNFGSTAIGGADKRIASIAAMKGGAGTQGQLWFFTNNGASWDIPLVVHNSGNVGVGHTIPAYTLDVNGTARINGTVHPVSDIRLKENVHSIEKSLDSLLRMKGVSYEWKDKSRGRDGRDLGLIAQDVEKIVPDLVRTDPSAMALKSLNYDGFTALFVEGIKELANRLEVLEKQRDSTVQDVNAQNGAHGTESALPQWVIVGLIAPWLPWIGVALFGWPPRRKL